MLLEFLFGEESLLFLEKSKKKVSLFGEESLSESPSFGEEKEKSHGGGRWKDVNGNAIYFEIFPEQEAKCLVVLWVYLLEQAGRDQLTSTILTLAE